jgi:regulator of replication initiation timing
VAVNVRPAHRRSGSQSSSTHSRSHGRTASFATQTEGEASPEVLALRSTVQLLLGDKSSLTARLNELETRLEERVAEAQKAKEEATAQVDQAQRRLKEGFALQREAEGRERALVRRSNLTLQRNADVLSLGVLSKIS